MLATAHCVLLEHYYSDDLPWWFDRKKCFTKTTNEMLTIVSFSVKWLKLKLHLVIWQKNCFWLTLLDEQIFKSFWKPNPWMNLFDFFFYYISFYSIFCSLSPLHREWPQLATILTSFNFFFVTKSKSLVFELKQAIHSGKDLTCKKKRIKTHTIVFFFKEIHPWIWLPEWFEDLVVQWS